jgi:hypothetical protein
MSPDFWLGVLVGLATFAALCVAVTVILAFGTAHTHDIAEPRVWTGPDDVDEFLQCLDEQRNETG